MERPSGPITRSGRSSRKKRTNCRREPHCDPKPQIVNQNALTCLADYAERPILKSYSPNVHSNMSLDSESGTLPSAGHVRPDENHEDGLREAFLESGCLGNQNKLKRLKRKLDSITQPLHTKNALKMEAGNRPVSIRSFDAANGCSALQKKKSGTNHGGKRPCREEEHSNVSGVPPPDSAHITVSSSSDSSSRHIPDEVPYALQGHPTSSSSPQPQPIFSAPQLAIPSVRPPAIYQLKDTPSDFNSSRSTSAASNKILISPDGSGFHPNPTEVVHCITRIIQNNFDEPWPTWKKVRINVRDQWFEEFQKWYCWQPDHARQIRLNFEARGMARLKDMFCWARKSLSVRPFWLSSEVWDDLKQYWESPEFQSKSEQAKLNRSSDRDGLGPSLHTCGSIPMSEHKRRLEEKTGEEVTPVKLFVHTHQRKDKTWIDARSSRAYEKFMKKWNELQTRQNSSDCDSQGERQKSAQPTKPAAGLSEAEVWVKTNLTKKGTIYGLGSEAIKYKCSNPSTSQSKETPQWFDTPEFQEYLSNKVAEISSEWNDRLEKERRDTEELRKRVAELEKERQERKSKKKAKKKLQQMKQMMQLMQMSYESLSKGQQPSDDDEEESTDSD